MEKLSEGTGITATLETGTIIGEIAGIASELGPAGYTYIIKITSRSGEAWLEYPYSCVVLPRSMFQTEEESEKEFKGTDMPFKVKDGARIYSTT
jgi:hypothetical protein